MTGVPRRDLGVVGLAALVARARLRHLWNQLRTRPTGPVGLIAMLTVGSSIAYVLLFVAALRIMGSVAGASAQVAALALMAGAIAAASLGSKAAPVDAAVAGTPENEFFLTRPVSLSMLVGARSLAAVATDPFGTLFLMPVLIAAGMIWKLPPSFLLVAIAISVLVQIAIGATAQTVQIVVTRWVPRRRRSWASVVLRLGSALALACVWIGSTWILRAPERLAPRLRDIEPWVALTPMALLVAPATAFRQAGGWAAVLALAPVAAIAAGALALAISVARRAGMHGWEEAGTPWDDSFAARSRAPLTPARREWRVLVRDRGRLTALVAAPAILIGVQIFGPIGWASATETLERVAVLTFSVTLYMAALGPLGHMQGERGAFWILRAVPVPVGQLMAAKARAWSVVLGGIACAMFALVSLGVTAARPPELLRLGLVVTGGTVGMTVLAVGLGCLVADLSDDQRPALRPGVVYLFLMIGGLFNLVVVAPGPLVLPVIAMYLVVIASTWRSGMAHVELCLDAEAVARRPVRWSEGAILVLVATLGPIAVAETFGRLGASRRAVIAGQVVLISTILGTAAYLFARRILQRKRLVQMTRPAENSLPRGTRKVRK